MKHPNCLHSENDSCVFCTGAFVTKIQEKRPTFERCADKTLLEKVRPIYTARGQEYSDSWALDNVITTFTRSTLRLFDLDLTDEQIRLLQAAALIDVKDSRMVGPFKEDSVVDGVAYRSLWLTLREEYENTASS